MAKNWQDVKNELEKEIDAVWFDEPAEITMIKKGVYPSGAGTFGQAFGNVVFAFADTHALGALVFEAPMFGFLKNDSFTLDQCKTIFYSFNMNKCRILGANHGPDSKCPAAWLNLPKFDKYFNEIYESYDSIKTKEEFADLLWSWFNYIDRINRWVYTIFPWEVVGQLMPVIKGDDMTAKDLRLCKEAGIIK